MHTYEAINGTRFHYKSDLSGDVIISSRGIRECVDGAALKKFALEIFTVEKLEPLDDVGRIFTAKYNVGDRVIFTRDQRTTATISDICILANKDRVHIGYNLKLGTSPERALFSIAEKWLEPIE